MAVPINGATLQNISTEIYGDTAAGRNLASSFSAATGDFDPTYQGSKNSLANFRGFATNKAIADGNTNTSTTKATATMTSNTTPSGIASESNCYHPAYGAWVAFDNSVNSGFFYSQLTNVWLQYQFPTAIPVNKYTIKCYDLIYYITDWTFQGSNDGVNFTTLDTRSGEVFYSQDYDYATYENIYRFNNKTKYLIYRLHVTGAVDDGRPRIKEIKIIECQYSA